MVTEVTYESWGSRLVASIKGVLVGMVLAVAAVGVLFWNEGRAVKRHKSLEEGKGAVVSVSAEKVDAANDRALVHLTGQAVTDETLADPDLGVKAAALKLRRSVEMYQWREETSTREEKQIGGGTKKITTYEYERVWSDDLIDSSRFKETAGHENPREMPIASRDVVAGRITLGAFRLSSSLVAMISSWQPLDLSGDAIAGLRREALGGGDPRISSSEIYLPARAGATPTGTAGGAASSPQIGDVRIRYAVVLPAVVSIVSQQVGDSFQPFQTSQEGYDVELLQMGTHAADAMFAEAIAANVRLTWIVRFAGWLVMAIGIAMVFRPLAVVADVIPILGDILGAGIFIFALAISAVVSLVTIGVAWIFYRPVLAIGLFAAALVALILFKVVGGKARAAKQGAEA